MKVSEIKITGVFKPPQYESLGVRGELLKDDASVASFPYQRLRLDTSGNTLWISEPPVEVDTLLIGLIGNDSQCTIIANSKRFVIEAAESPEEVWTDYRFDLPKMESWPFVVAGGLIATLGALIVMVSRMEKKTAARER